MSYGPDPSGYDPAGRDDHLGDPSLPNDGYIEEGLAQAAPGPEPEVDCDNVGHWIGGEVGAPGGHDGDDEGTPCDPPAPVAAPSTGPEERADARSDARALVDLADYWSMDPLEAQRRILAAIEADGAFLDTPARLRPSPPVSVDTAQPDEDALAQLAERVGQAEQLLRLTRERAELDGWRPMWFSNYVTPFLTALAARSTPQPTERADGLVEVGWLGATWEDATWHDLAPDYEIALDEGEAIVVEKNDGQYVYNPGDWSIRHEDGADDLIQPIALYVKAADLAAYTAAPPTSAGPDLTPGDPEIAAEG